MRGEEVLGCCTLIWTVDPGITANRAVTALINSSIHGLHGLSTVSKDSVIPLVLKYDPFRPEVVPAKSTHGNWILQAPV